MKITLNWHETLAFQDGTDDNLIYKCDLSKISNKPGIYVFAREFGNSVCPLYIGETLNLRKRIEEHLNNTKLMMGIKNAPSGKRILLTAVLKPTFNLEVQRSEKRLRLVF